MCSLLRHQSAPNVEIETFTGNPLDCHYFISAFKEAVEYKINDQHGRLVRFANCYWNNIMETLIEHWQHIERRSRVDHY